MKLFSSQTYTERRSILKKKLGGGLALFLGNNESPMNYTDNTYRFRQDSNFLYFFGLNMPGLAATLDADTGEEIIYGDEFSIEDIIWVGQQETISDLSKKVGVFRNEASSKLANKIKDSLSKGQKVHILPAYRSENTFKLMDLFSCNRLELKDYVSTEFIKGIVSLRSIKSSEEILQMEEALAITRAMHIAAIQSKAVGKKEYELVAAAATKMHEKNGELAYPFILTQNGQTLHNHDHSHTLSSGRLLINDSGAENTMCYAADITRTFPVDATFTSKQREIYEIVLAMEESSIESLKAGIQYKTVHLNANRLMLSKLSEIGLVKGDVDEMLDLGVGGLFMPHGLGHMIGLDVHDMEDLGENYVGYRDGLERSTQLGLKSLRLAKELESGNVLTVEPGIYFIPELIAKWEAENKFDNFIQYSKLANYLDFGGIRIEDNVLVTENSFKVLGERIPKTISELEKL